MNRLNRLNREANHNAYLSYAFILGREIYAYYSVSHGLRPNRAWKYNDRKSEHQGSVLTSLGINIMELKKTGLRIEYIGMSFFVFFFVDFNYISHQESQGFISFSFVDLINTFLQLCVHQINIFLFTEESVIPLPSPLAVWCRCIDFAYFVRNFVHYLSINLFFIFLRLLSKPFFKAKGPYILKSYLNTICLFIGNFFNLLKCLFVRGRHRPQLCNLFKRHTPTGLYPPFSQNFMEV
jgi:hypothetical protein